MPKTEADLTQRIAGREWAEEVLAALPDDEISRYRRGFMDCVKRYFTVQEIDPRAMTDKESRTFGQMQMGFGSHSALTYDECPMDYLEWLEEANRNLSRYLRSRRIRAERIHDDA